MPSGPWPTRGICLALPERYGDAEAAPLLCAGLIGHRALVAAGDAARLGLYGFGAAAHLVAQVARHAGAAGVRLHPGGDERAARSPASSGPSGPGRAPAPPPEPLDAAILFAPVGALVPAALRAVAPGRHGRVRRDSHEPIPSFPYELLWGERILRSVANLTRADGEAFLRIAARVPLRVATETLPLSRANDGLERLRAGRVRGAAVLLPDPARIKL